MLWSKINFALQFIYWASIYLLNNKNTRLMSLTLFWCLYCWLQTHFTSCFSVSVSIVNMKLVKSRLGSTSHHSKKPWYRFFVICKKRLFCCSQCNLCRSFWKNSLQFKVINNFTTSSILRSVVGCWICLGYFLRFIFKINLFISPNIFKK